MRSIVCSVVACATLAAAPYPVPAQERCSPPDTTVRPAVAMNPADSAVLAAIREVQRAACEAGMRRDRAAYERVLAPGFVFIHSTGGIDSRAMFITGATEGGRFVRPPGGAPRTHALAEELHVHGGHTAILISRTELPASPAAQPAAAPDSAAVRPARVRTVNVYVKDGGAWQWAFHQSTVLPARPPALVTLAPAVLDSLAGRYEALSASRSLLITPGQTVAVGRDSSGLVLQLRYGVPYELVPRTLAATEVTFALFHPDNFAEREVAFLRDGSGRVTAVVFRDGKREVWRARRVE